MPRGRKAAAWAWLDWRPELPPCRYTDGTFHPDFWGPDGIPYTYDDYYSYQEFLNGWYPLVHVGPDGIPGTEDDIDEPEYSKFCNLIGESNCLPIEKTLPIERTQLNPRPPLPLEGGREG